MSGLNKKLLNVAIVGGLAYYYSEDKKNTRKYIEEKLKESEKNTQEQIQTAIDTLLDNEEQNNRFNDPAIPDNQIAKLVYPKCFFSAIGGMSDKYWSWGVWALFVNNSEFNVSIVVKSAELIIAGHRQDINHITDKNTTNIILAPHSERYVLLSTRARKRMFTSKIARSEVRQSIRSFRTHWRRINVTYNIGGVQYESSNAIDVDLQMMPCPIDHYRFGYNTISEFINQYKRFINGWISDFAKNKELEQYRKSKGFE